MAKTKLTPAEKRAIFRENQRKGDIVSLARETGYSASYVSEVISAKYTNVSILDAAYALGKSRSYRSKKK
jgi:hypothetical protein